MNIEKKIQNFINTYDFADQLCHLIQIDTQNPPGNELDIISYIQNHYEKNQLEKYLFTHGENRGSLIIKLTGKSNEGIAFIGHVDTVPVGDATEWTKLLKAGKREGKLIYGRGASDMKSGIVAMLAVLDFAIQNRLQPDKNIYFVFTADEEVNSMGIKTVCDSELIQVGEVIIPEPTGNCISLQEKGSIWIQLKGYGKQSHGAMPNQGVNAIDCIYEYIQYFKDAFLKDKSDSTVALTILNGGNKSNIVPGYAEAVLDIRTTSEMEHSECKNLLEKFISQWKHEKNCHVEYDILAEHIPCVQNENSKFVQKLSRVCEKITKNRSYISTVFYTDLEIFLARNKKHIDFAILGPGRIDSMHKADEYVDIEEVKKTTQIYLNYLFLKNTEIISEKTSQ